MRGPAEQVGAAALQWLCARARGERACAEARARLVAARAHHLALHEILTSTSMRARLLCWRRLLCACCVARTYSGISKKTAYIL